MANVLYAGKAKQFRKCYPIPLKLRHGIEALNSLSDHEYRNMLMDYLEEVVYRSHRGKTKLKGSALFRTADKVKEKYMKPIRERYKELCWLIKPHSDIRFWSFEKSYGFKWKPVAASYLKCYVPEKHLQYKRSWNTAKKGPIEAELIPIAGPYSLAPWLVTAYKSHFKKCPLCGRVFSAKSYRKAGWYPQTKEHSVSEDLNWYYSRRFSISVCDGPCGDLMYLLDNTTLKLKHISHPFLPIPVFLGVIDYANYNPYFRRTAENFVRYARSFLESRSDSSGRQGNREVSRQRTEICIN